MPDASERLVNLAFFIASARQPVTAAQVRASVSGYPADQDEAAFLRMFERDKEDLRAAGLSIAIDRSGDAESYRLDRQATFAGEIALAPEEAALLGIAGAAMLGDPSFPFGGDLRLALAKVAAATGTAPGDPLPVAALTADESPEAQADAVSALARAIAACKRVTFTYTNTAGTTASREVEPYGVTARGGRWYAIGRDVAADDMRVFAVARLSGLTVNPAQPKSADFERPADFDIGQWTGLPFQFGPVVAEGRLRLSREAAARLGALASRSGSTEPMADGSVAWSMPVSDPAALAAWALEQGPGVRVLAPAEAVEALTCGLRETADAHA